MKKPGTVIVSALISGVLVIVPVYLAILLLLKGMPSVAGLTRPLAMLLPSSVPAETILSLLLVLAVCIVVGAAVPTSTGRALAEIADALVPAFMVEEFDDGRFTVFVPSIPTPLAGAVYILRRERLAPGLPAGRAGTP